MGLIKISFTLTWGGDSTAYKIAFAMSSACNASIFFAFSTNPFKDSSVIVSLSSVATTPGSSPGQAARLADELRTTDYGLRTRMSW